MPVGCPAALLAAAMLGVAPTAPGLAALLGLGWAAVLSLALAARAWRDGRGPALDGTAADLRSTRVP